MCLCDCKIETIMSTPASNETVHCEAKAPLGLSVFIDVEQNCYFPVFQEELEIFQHKISNISQQAAEDVQRDILQLLVL